MKKIFFLKIISPFIFFILLIPEIVVLNGCANMIPPTGGPRDSLPPVLVRVTPVDSSKNFKTKTIVFTFDEYIDQPQEQFKNLIISPTPSVMPQVETKLRTLTVKIKDTLEPNTTYYYNFGKMIKDVNEGNVLDGLTYIFSTGNTIDSLQLSGNVVLAETGGIDSTLMVMLHRNGDDSAVMKERPRFVTRLDGKGFFRFQYLPAGKYYLYALKDETNSGRYSEKSPFAFADSAVEIKPGSSSITLYAYTEKKDAPPATTITFGGGNRAGGTRTDDKRLKFSTSLSGNVQDLLTSFSLNTEYPVRNFDTTKLQLSTDSSFTPVAASWSSDSLKKKLTLAASWKENTLYNLILDKEFAEDSAGRKLLKTDTISFTTRKQADYGSLKISFTKIDLAQHPVLQLSQGGQVLKAFPLTSPEIYQALFNPGEYELSFLYDKNQNGKWDPGEFFNKRKQPELVKPLNKKITIRANWDNEFEITL
jgi:hypothetical protein